MTFSRSERNSKQGQAGNNQLTQEGTTEPVSHRRPVLQCPIICSTSHKEDWRQTLSPLVESNFANIAARFFTESVATALFVVLGICYSVQSVLASLRARERLDESPDGVSVTLRDVVRLHDGGRSNVWAFFALAILSPVVLTSIGNITALTLPALTSDAVGAAAYFLLPCCNRCANYTRTVSCLAVAP